MKNIKKILTTLLLIMIFSACFSPTTIVNARSLADKPIILLSNISEYPEIVLRANLADNTGISDMLLEIRYDDSVMELTNVEKGDALSSLGYIPSGNYSVKPFKVYYYTDDAINDSSTGVLFEMHFRLKSDIQDGKYKISLGYKKDADVWYYENGEHKTKNLIVDNVEITLRNNSVSKVDIINSGDEVVDNVKSNTILIVVIVLSAILVTSAVIIIAGKVRSKKRNWKRL